MNDRATLSRTSVRPILQLGYESRSAAGRGDRRRRCERGADGPGARARSADSTGVACAVACGTEPGTEPGEAEEAARVRGGAAVLELGAGGRPDAADIRHGGAGPAGGSLRVRVPPRARVAAQVQADARRLAGARGMRADASESGQGPAPGRAMSRQIPPENRPWDDAVRVWTRA